MQKIPVSVFIIAKNEADRIAYTLNSVQDFASEIIVVDSGSEDATLEISKAFGAKTLFNKWQGYGPQKTFAQNLCQNDWVLNLDADEELSPALRDEIIALFANGAEPNLKAYKLPIKILGRFAKEPGFFAPSNSPVRFYNKKFAGFKDSHIHDSVIFKNLQFPLGKFKNPCIHRCFRSYEHAINKINSYSSMQAEDFYNRSIKISSTRIIIEPFFAFFKAYFLRRYFLWGTEGVVESVIYSFSRTIRLAKARELYLKKQIEAKQNKPIA